MADASQPDLAAILATTAHRPYPIPSRPWRLRQRWNDLLFAHWPVSPLDIERLLPAGLEVDTFAGDAYLGVIPFWMDQVLTRLSGKRTIAIPTTTTFPELNLRTYVRSRVSGRAGVYFFSLDCASPLAVLGARTLFHLPYFPARMTRTVLAGGQTRYTSRRQFTRKPANYEAVYGPMPRESEPHLANSLGQRVLCSASLTQFLTERYCLFTPALGRMLIGHIHHLPWPLEPARANIVTNEIAMLQGLTLPDTPPILHFARSLDVFLWSLEADTASGSRR